MTARRARLLLAIVVGAVGLLTAHASIRSPDAEVVYRTGESLALRGSFAVEEDLALWHGFGLPEGRDGRRYSVFGPLQAMYEAPAIWLVERLIPRDWATDEPSMPASHYYGKDPLLWTGKPPPAADSRAHLVRAWVSLLDVLTLVLIAIAAFDLALLVSGSVLVAWLAGIVFTTGTFLLSYVTTLFSEPLAVLLTLWGLRALVAEDPLIAQPSTAGARRFFVGGLAFSLAAAAHISAVVAFPFVGLYVLGLGRERRTLIVGFAAGIALPLLMLGVYNQQRFGSWLETGRGLQTGFLYGTFVSPDEGLVGLTISWGKGLLWYCPALILAFVFLRSAYRTNALLAAVAASAVLGRLLFIATRSDWHGGFCVGPRYMLLALPFGLILPLLAIRGRVEVLQQGRAWIATLLVSCLLVVEQLYFASGEIFGFGQLMRQRGAAILKAGGNPSLYFDWELSPLRSLLSRTRGPLLYRWLFTSSWLNWCLLSVVVLVVVVLISRSIRRQERIG